MPEPLRDFKRSRALPHDLALLGRVVRWLGSDGILYCGHNMLFWTAWLRRLGLLRCRLVGLLYGTESLAFPEAFAGVIGLTPAATERARKLAPQAKVAHLGWGADLQFYPRLPYRPGWFLSCGKSRRDPKTLIAAAEAANLPLKLIGCDLAAERGRHRNVEIVTGSQSDGNVTYQSLIHDYYAECTAALVILSPSSAAGGAAGLTSLLEAMALARPVIVTRAGTLPAEFDVEASGCGIFVPPGDVSAVAQAMKHLADNPAKAALMGDKGRAACEAHYNIDRFTASLHDFFETL
jgi:glycosyltransferase involved in cell wall biosynthesis